MHVMHAKPLRLTTEEQGSSAKFLEKNKYGGEKDAVN